MQYIGTISPFHPRTHFSTVNPARAYSSTDAEFGLTGSLLNDKCADYFNAVHKDIAYMNYNAPNPTSPGNFYNSQVIGDLSDNLGGYKKSNNTVYDNHFQITLSTPIIFNDTFNFGFEYSYAALTSFVNGHSNLGFAIGSDNFIVGFQFGQANPFFRKNNVALSVDSVIPLTNTVANSSVQYTKVFMVDDLVYMKAIFSSNPAVSYLASASITPDTPITNLRTVASTNVIRNLNLYRYDETDVTKSLNEPDNVFSFKPHMIELPIGSPNVTYTATSSGDMEQNPVTLFNNLTSPDFNLSGSIEDVEFGYMVSQSLQYYATSTDRRPLGNINKIMGVRFTLMNESQDTALLDGGDNEIEMKLEYGSTVATHSAIYNTNNKRITSHFFDFTDAPLDATITNTKYTIKDIT